MDETELIEAQERFETIVKLVGLAESKSLDYVKSQVNFTREDLATLGTLNTACALIRGQEDLFREALEFIDMFLKDKEKFSV